VVILVIARWKNDPLKYCEMGEMLTDGVRGTNGPRNIGR
jgi:hypothetical protein